MSDPPRPDSNDSPARTDRTVLQSPSHAATASERSAMPSPNLPPGFVHVRRLGRGGMGVVYLAEQTDLRRPVAVKFILGGGHASDTLAARLRTETEVMARVRHPNVVTVHAGGWHDALPYLVTEYMDDGSLADRLADGPLEPRAAAVLLAQVARGVAACHAQGILHRDLKPANILLAADGTPKVADFGLAKVLTDESGQTTTGAILGTPCYMAPEQAQVEFQKVGPSADVYGLGAVLYHAVTGRPPYTGPTAAAVLVQVMTADPPPVRRLRSEVPTGLETIVRKSMSKHPADRYRSADELADDLDRFLRGERPSARVRRQMSRRDAVVGVVVGTGFVTTTLGIGFGYLSNRRPPFRPEEVYDGSVLHWNPIGGSWAVGKDADGATVLEGSVPVTRAVQGGRSFRLTVGLGLHEARSVELRFGPAAVSITKAGAAGVPYPDRAGKAPYVEVRFERAGGRWRAFFDGQPAGEWADADGRLGPFELMITPAGGPVRIESARTEPAG